jgi:hypothetical protein
MSLDRLAVVHQRKTPGVVDAAEWPLPPSAFRLETCLRRLAIGDAADLAATPERRDTDRLATDAFDRYRGAAGYEFLLRVACGLESNIAGESEVFGQIKEAWRTHEREHAALARAHAPVMQRVFEDVKEIRARHLQHAGTVTYGGLVRHLLGGAMEAPVLLVGAGQMAQAVVPYLSGRPLYLWNRTRARAEALRGKVSESIPSLATPVVLDNTLEAELELWRTAANVVVCIPADPERDAARLAAWRQNPNRCRLMHLGLLDASGTCWQGAFGLSTLADLFTLQSSHNELRAAHIARAGAACREKARLRSLGGPSSLAHGWEDLSLFAGTA